MQHFLASLDYQTKNISLLEYSSNIEILESEKIFLLFNGTLRNKEHLCLELKCKDLQQLLLKAYQTYGIDFLKRLEGSFTLFIYDKQAEQLFIAKDKIGIQPLYFKQTEHMIIFGTNLKAFQKVEDIELTVEPNAVANYLQFGFVLQPNTIFKDCYKVESGAYISFDINKKQEKKINCYWRLESYYTKKKSQQSEEESIAKAHLLLEKSVEQSRKDSHFGLSLSGGYDSSTLVAIAQAQSSKKVDTFSIGFHENQINEAPYAKAIAKHLGTNHHEYYFTAEDALELIPKMALVYDEPFADHASSPTMLTAQLLKQHNIENLIAGDGGDEVFATAEDVHTFERLKNTPQLLKKLIAKPLSYFSLEYIPYLKEHNNLPKKYNKLIQILLAKNIPEMIRTRNTLFLEKELHNHIKRYQQPILTSFENIDFEDSTECVDEIIGTYFKTTMVDGELVKSYSAMNNQNIRLSTPYLNSQLVEYMARVPSSIKIKDGIKKYILKEIAYKYIPKDIIERPKCGFDIPFGSWMKKELKEILYFQINKERLDKDNIFYTSSILNIRDQFYAGNDAYKYKLWRVFIFQLWYEAFSSKSLKDKSSKSV